MKAKNLVWLLVAVLVVLFVMRISSRMSGGKETQEEKIVPVVSQLPKLGLMEEKLALTGDVKAAKEVGVRPRVTGRVAEIYVDEGDEVAEGDPMMSYVAGITPDDDLYNDMVLSAPINGVVGMKMVKEGDQIVSGPTGISPVFNIYDIDNIKIYANVPEKFVSNIRKGTKALIKFDAYPDKTFTAVVNNVRPVVDSLSRTTQVEISMSNPGRSIRPGMFAKVELVLKSIPTAVVLPIDAVLGETEKFVYVIQGGKASRRMVTTGIMQGNDIQITFGITSADKVITVGQRVVSDGVEVKEAE